MDTLSSVNELFKNHHMNKIIARTSSPITPPKGQPMPQTVEHFEKLAISDLNTIMQMKDEIIRLKRKNNQLRQENNQLRRK